MRRVGKAAGICRKQGDSAVTAGEAGQEAYRGEAKDATGGGQAHTEDPKGTQG